MKLDNQTPLSATVFERRGLEGEPLAVALFQATLRFDEGSEALVLADTQEPVNLLDIYRGDPKRTSLRRATSVTTVRPSSDITLDAVAHAPEGSPLDSWVAAVRVGDVAKTVRVYGERWWQRTRNGWELSEPALATEVPIEYERAFGGVFVDNSGLHEENQNPVGVGYLPFGIQALPARVVAPQIVHAAEPLQPPQSVGNRPAGFGPIPSHFEPRASRLGTTDARWERERFPRFPTDFDVRFFQVAHPDLISPHPLRGDEVIVLENLTKGGGVVRTKLPGAKLVVFLELGRTLVGLPATVDSLHLDLSAEPREAHRAYLTFRVTIARELSLSMHARWVPEEPVGTSSTRRQPELPSTYGLQPLLSPKATQQP